MNFMRHGVGGMSHDHPALGSNETPTTTSQERDVNIIKQGNISYKGACTVCETTFICAPSEVVSGFIYSAICPSCGHLVRVWVHREKPRSET